MKELLLLDNRDSFTYNLVEYCRKVGSHRIRVMQPKDFLCHSFAPDRVIVSPGPGLPRESEGLFECLDLLWGKVPLLGVCLGMQAMVEYCGGGLKQLQAPLHGIASKLCLMYSSSIFYQVSDKSNVGRYHSWIVDKESLPLNFMVTAEDSLGNIMAIQDHKNKAYGVQFHPESIITEDGLQMIENFLTVDR